MRIAKSLTILRPARRRSAGGCLLAAVLLWAAPAVSEASPVEGRGRRLPVGDQIGNRAIAQLAEGVLSEELVREHELADPRGLRGVLRRERVRDVASASPLRLDRVAAAFEADWLFSAGLFEADSRGTPQVTLAGLVYRSGDRELPWAGFASGSGLDGRTWLLLGVEESLEEETRRVAVELAADFAGAASSQGKVRPVRGGFLRPGFSGERVGRAAVVPFDGVSDFQPAVAAEAATLATQAALHRRGVPLLYPGVVAEAQRRQRSLYRGEVSRGLWQALREEEGIDSVLTGTVETWETREGGEPEPWIALSARLVDTGDGRILWFDGQERRGWDRERPFRFGRLYAVGQLAREMTDSLVAGFLGRPDPSTRQGQP